MACIENVPAVNADSEMEEGEIIDDLDDLSDISSEEEFLLRQRLQVLENYNNVLERKKAKTSLSESGKEKNEDALSHDLSDISDREDILQDPIEKKKHKHLYLNVHRKQKRRKESLQLISGKNKEHKKHRNKKKIVPKVIISESSEESEDEYRNKRRKLANAVSVFTQKNDTSSLKDRLEKMLCGNQNFEHMKEEIEEKITIDIAKSLDWSLNSSETNEISSNNKTVKENSVNTLESEVNNIIELSEDDVKLINDASGEDFVDSVFIKRKEVEEKEDVNKDSDEDLELLRQHALKTKVSKQKIEKPDVDIKVNQSKPQKISEDEDSDTAELRMICLKSALLKKAIEAKQKQKLRKRLSQSFHDEFQLADTKISNEVDADNNTDIESVDMDIGSDGDDKLKEFSGNYGIIEEIKQDCGSKKEISLNAVPMSNQSIEDEVDEDEDLLRAKLLTSLSKNLPNLIRPNIINSLKDTQGSEKSTTEVQTNKSNHILKEKPFIIKIGESDSEGEHEATKNLTKMHMKLSEQIDFQQKLDLFLKSTRMEVENKTLPDVVQRPLEQPNSTTKFVAKAVKHLPKSEQIEYKNLVKRMTELEKIKQARQTSMSLSKLTIQSKDTLKPRNVTIDTTNSNAMENLEEQIALSRKYIAEESSKMLKLKEEATKLSQKYKIVETELRNISTAIAFNKRQQKTIQNKLTNIRLQHQMLLKRSSTLKHSKINMPLANRNSSKTMQLAKLQKENNPKKEDFRNPLILKSVKVSVNNDLEGDKVASPLLSVQVDISSNKKIVKMPKTAIKERKVGLEVENPSTMNIHENKNNNQPEVEKTTMDIENINNANDSAIVEIKEIDDYKSPLEALHGGTWVEDPNSFLCPFEVGGTCKDPDCKYIHPKLPSAQ